MTARRDNPEPMDEFRDIFGYSEPDPERLAEAERKLAEWTGWPLDAVQDYRWMTRGGAERFRADALAAIRERATEGLPEELRRKLREDDE